MIKKQISKQNQETKKQAKTIQQKKRNKVKQKK